MQDLYSRSKDPSQEHVLEHADYAAPTRQDELVIIQIRHLSDLNDLHHEVGIHHTDHLAEVRKGARSSRSSTRRYEMCPSGKGVQQRRVKVPFG